MLKFFCTDGDALMTKSTAAAMLTLSLLFAGSAAIDVAAAPSQTVVQTRQVREVGDLSARHRTRGVTRYANRAYDPPAYYDRPNYYRPYPYAVPVPFFLGFGFEPWW
jgi:hypothetical protein